MQRFASTRCEGELAQVMYALKEDRHILTHEIQKLTSTQFCRTSVKIDDSLFNRTFLVMPFDQSSIGYGYHKKEGRKSVLCFFKLNR